jgi:cation diffusion facilitator CzcD-associated flavoprotein CzcO
VPDYPLGCKRILISNDWYPTLLRPNVAVVTAPVERIDRRRGVVAGGVEHPVDTIIFGTGFESTGFLAPIRVTGRDGRSICTPSGATAPRPTSGSP